MSFYTDNPIKDFERHDAEQERELDKLPKCAECDHPIQDDECYEIGDELICHECLIKNHRKWTENYIRN